MRRDIYKLAKWLEKVCQQGIVDERKMLEWKLSSHSAEKAEQTKAS